MITLGCPKHPRYEGKRKPRVDCGPCWFIYDLRQARFFTLEDERMVVR